jgi:uncharacterized protein YjbI with pentapeptide repeats
VREHSHRQPTGNPKEALLQARFADVQLALTALGRRTPMPSDPPLDLGGSDLHGARLDLNARLEAADLGGADLRGVMFRNVNFRDADLYDVRLDNLQRMSFTGQ